MMNTFNTFILDITVSIIDFLYRGRDYQRFWVLEEIAKSLLCLLKRTTLKGVVRSSWSSTHLSHGGTFCSNS